MVLVLSETEKFQRPIATGSIKSVEIFSWTFVNESKLGQNFSVELSRHFHVFHPQIDVIKATRFHVRASTAWRTTSNACDPL